MFEVHGVAGIKVIDISAQRSVLVRDGSALVRLSIGNTEVGLTLEEADFLAAKLWESAKRVRGNAKP